MEVACDNCYLFFYFGLTVIGYLLFNEYVQGGQYKKTNKIDGKIVIVTGSNTGIGKETALELAKRGGKIYMACSDIDKAKTACDEIKRESGNEQIFVRKLDLSSFQSIRNFVDL